MSDELEVLKSVTTRLEGAGIPYMVRLDGGELQLDDVRNLLRSVQGLDIEYLSRWVDRLGLTTLYQEVRQ